MLTFFVLYIRVSYVTNVLLKVLHMIVRVGGGGVWQQPLDQQNKNKMKNKTKNTFKCGGGGGVGVATLRKAKIHKKRKSFENIWGRFNDEGLWPECVSPCMQSTSSIGARSVELRQIYIKIIRYLKTSMNT